MNAEDFIAELNAAVVSEHYFTASDGVVGASATDGHTLGPHPDAAIPALGLITFCVLVLDNGFSVVGHATCERSEAFDPETFKQSARMNADDKLWAFIWFRLRERAATQPVPLPPSEE